MGSAEGQLQLVQLNVTVSRASPFRLFWLFDAFKVTIAGVRMGGWSSVASTVIFVISILVFQNCKNKTKKPFRVPINFWIKLNQQVWQKLVLKLSGTSRWTDTQLHTQKNCSPELSCTNGFQLCCTYTPDDSGSPSWWSALVCCHWCGKVGGI